MKRHSEDHAGPNIKRVKSDGHVNGGSDVLDPTFDSSKLRKATDISDRGIIDEDGYLAISVHMRWDASGKPKKLQIQAESHENGNTVRFDVFFLEPCVRHFEAIGLKFDVQDMVLLSLSVSLSLLRKLISNELNSTLQLTAESHNDHHVEELELDIIQICFLSALVCPS